MRSIFLIFLPVMLGWMSCAQKPADPAPFTAVIDTALLHRHLRTLADPGMQGRETATPGEQKAAAYISGEFSRLGLQPVNGSFEIPFRVYRDSLVQVTLSIDGKTYQRYKDFDLYLNYGHRHNISAYGAVYAGHGIVTNHINDYQNIDARQKIAVVDDGEPMLNDSLYTISGTKEKSRMASVREKLKNAMQQKAVALFIVKNIEPGTGNSDLGRLYVEPEKNEPVIPVYFISPRLKPLVLSYKHTPEEMRYIKSNRKPIVLRDSCLTQTRQSRNVLAVLEGSDRKNEYVFITAHYDHLGIKDNEVYCGADDNASGTSAVLAIAQALCEAKKAGHGPRRTVVFMLVSGEEKGLLGSRYYTANPLFPLDKTSIDLNIDMIGRVGGDYTGNKDSLNYIYLIGDDKISSDLEPLCEKSNRETKLILDRRYNDPADPNRFYYRSDHYNFAKKGVPIVFYFDGVHSDYHRPGDTADRINLPLMDKRAQLVLNTAMEAACMNRMLRRDRPLEE